MAKMSSILLCLCLSIQLMHCKMEVKPKKPEAAIKSKEQLIIKNLLTNINFHDSILLKRDMVLTDDHGKKVLLSSLFLKREKILFFFFSKNFCDMCIDREMKKLKYIPSDRKDQVVILLSVNNTNETRLYKERYNLGFKFFNIGDIILSRKLRSLYSPYYFIADQKLNTSMLFIPDKNIDEPTRAYLKEVLGF